MCPGLSLRGVIVSGRAVRSSQPDEVRCVTGESISKLRDHFVPGVSLVKTTLLDDTGQEVAVLCVKGSGWDLGNIEPAGLPAHTASVRSPSQSVRNLTTWFQLGALRQFELRVLGVTANLPTLSGGSRDWPKSGHRPSRRGHRPSWPITWVQLSLSTPPSTPGSGRAFFFLSVPTSPGQAQTGLGSRRLR